jgi:hypothetical protein
MNYFPLLLLLPLLTLSFPLPTSSLSSKTYSFNSQAAFNYTTTGPITYTTTNATTNWYNSNWSYRQQITIKKDYIGEELTDFPVLIRLDNTSLTGVRDDYHDLVLTTNDGITEIPYEREDNTNLWVKVPKLTPTEDTVIYLYCGNPTVTEDKQRPEEVWTNGYAAVYHLNESPALGAQDATLNENNSLAAVVMNETDNLRAGFIGYARRFTGNTGINVGKPISNFISADEGTISLWFKADGTQGFSSGTTYLKPPLILDQSAYMGIFVDTTKLYMYNWDGNEDTVSTEYDNSQWHQAVWRHGDGMLVGFKDGAKFAEKVSGLTEVISNNLHISSTKYRGLIDHVVISNQVRSDDWISAEYANQANTDNFLTISPTVESHPSTGSGSTITLKTDRPLSYTSLTSFTPNGSPTNTYQLSPDNGKTWYYYTVTGWQPTTTQASSANDITNHLNTFPKQTGQLLWKAFIPSGNTLDSITITYTPASAKATAGKALPTSLSDPRIQVINELHRQVFNRPPTFQEWLTYVNKLINGEKQTAEELLGAMEYQALQGR